MKNNKSSSHDFDLIVIGAGSGGVRCSRIAAKLGARVALIESKELGGTCVNLGCVPKKLFSYAAQFKQDFKVAQSFGWEKAESKHHWQKLVQHKNKEIMRLNKAYKNLLETAGVHIIEGFAQLESPNCVKVGEQIFKSKYIVIATGSTPHSPDFEGKQLAKTSDDMFHLEKLPKRILISGAGYIGVEFASILKGLGVDVEIVFRSDRILKHFDQECGDFLNNEMQENGIQLSPNKTISKIEKNSSQSLTVSLSDGSKREVDLVLSALGRRPAVDGLGLDKLGVKQNTDTSLIVDDNFQTSVPSIYALGDVIARVQLTPVALAEGQCLAEHLFAGKNKILDYSQIATAVFSHPNLASIGVNETQAAAMGEDVLVYRSDFKAMRLSLSSEKERNFIKLVCSKSSKKVIGAFMVGDHAGEIVQGLAIAIKAGATMEHFQETIGIHPTSAEEFVSLIK